MCPWIGSPTASYSSGGNLYHNIRYANGSWQGWIAIVGLDGSGIWTGTGVIAGLPDGSSQVFARQQSNVVTTWENTRASNGSWSGWTLVPGSNQMAAAAGFGAVG